MAVSYKTRAYPQKTYSKALSHSVFLTQPADIFSGKSSSTPSPKQISEIRDFEIKMFKTYIDIDYISNFDGIKDKIYEKVKESIREVKISDLIYFSRRSTPSYFTTSEGKKSFIRIGQKDGILTPNFLHTSGDNNSVVIYTGDDRLISYLQDIVGTGGEVIILYPKTCNSPWTHYKEWKWVFQLDLENSSTSLNISTKSKETDELDETLLYKPSGQMGLLTPVGPHALAGPHTPCGPSGNSDFGPLFLHAATPAGPNIPKAIARTYQETKSPQRSSSSKFYVEPCHSEIETSASETVSRVSESEVGSQYFDDEDDEYQSLMECKYFQIGHCDKGRDCTFSHLCKFCGRKGDKNCSYCTSPDNYYIIDEEAKIEDSKQGKLKKSVGIVYYSFIRWVKLRVGVMKRGTNPKDLITFEDSCTPYQLFLFNTLKDKRYSLSGETTDKKNLMVEKWIREM